MSEDLNVPVWNMQDRNDIEVIINNQRVILEVLQALAASISGNVLNHAAAGAIIKATGERLDVLKARANWPVVKT